MDGGYATMIVIGLLTAAAIRRDQAYCDEARRAERQRKFRAMAVIIAAVGALFYAVLLAVLSLSLVYETIFGLGPRSVLTFLMVPACASASVGLGWIGLLLLRDKDLPGRLARAWAAAVEAFFEPVPEGSKPKPARGEHDLD